MVLNKAEKREVDLINAKLSDNFKELDYKSSDQINALGKYLDKYSQEFSHFKDLMVEGKVDTKDFEKLA